MENETNVAPGPTSPEPAKTAEIESAGGARASSPGAEASAADETKVSIIAVVRGYLAEHPIEEWLEPKLEQLKREILEKVSELVTPIVAKSTEAQGAAPAATAEVPTIPVAATASRTGPTRGVMVEEEELPHELGVGDSVKVWADAAHRTFWFGTVVAVHDAGIAYDVNVITHEGESVTKIPADGLEFDDRR